MKLQILKSLRNYGLLQDIDIHFAELMARLAGDTAGDELFLAAALVSNATTDEKHVCFNLNARAGKPLASLFPDLPDELRKELTAKKLPGLTAWRHKLAGRPVVGKPGDYRPLILDDQDRLYLFRYWNYEQQLAAFIRQRASAHGDDIDLTLVRQGFNKYFTSPLSTPDWQKVAAFAALTHSFSVISGGPGTGKTFTVAVMLRLLLEQNSRLNIKLCAPTGKAAARLAEAIQQSLPDYGEKLSQNISTIHRLLGYRNGSPYFVHDRTNPLAADVVIVDEASMVPLALMAKLVDAVPAHSRIVLLGDKDQLASVEAGSVLGDICEAADVKRFSPDFCLKYREASGEEIPPAHRAAETSSLTNCAVELQHSYRFKEAPAIGAVSIAVNAGDKHMALDILRHDTTGAIVYNRLPGRDELADRLAPLVRSWYEGVFLATTRDAAYERFSAFRILCSHRQGPYGAERINDLVEHILRSQGFIHSLKSFYKGRPVMITKNDYTLRLFNGDTGIIWEDGGRQLSACFPDQGRPFREISPSRMPEHETAYAITIHKSQGSEFDHVLIILPDSESPLLTREILYTGITRTRKQIELWVTDEVFSSSVGKRIERTSGLRDALLAG